MEDNDMRNKEEFIAALISIREFARSQQEFETVKHIDMILESLKSF